ncbi:MAG: hypothetical protein ABF990_00195 [Acetobacter sp.]
MPGNAGIEQEVLTEGFARIKPVATNDLCQAFQFGWQRPRLP